MGAPTRYYRTVVNGDWRAVHEDGDPVSIVAVERLMNAHVECVRSDRRAKVPQIVLYGVLADWESYVSKLPKLPRGEQ